jgi:nicotinamidase-related amidase
LELRLPVGTFSRLLRSNNYLGFTELPKLLFTQDPPIHTLVVVGLATDYCVLSSAVDAVKFQFKTIIVEEGIKGVDPQSVKEAHQEMKEWGVKFVKSDKDLFQVLST